MISPISPEKSSVGTVARKRRRQIIQSQRINAPPSKKTCVEPITQSNDRSQKASGAQLSSKVAKKTPAAKPKKPQMRYDPDIPMTKEEAAAWRKEQRRKRNRESAAASRQRQRDRISELEQEVSEWKSKYEEALARIERLEKGGVYRSMDCAASATSLPLESTAVSLCSSSQQCPSSPSPCHSTSMPCDVVLLQEQNQYSEMGNPIACQGIHEKVNHVKHLSEKISRPA